MKSNKNKLGSKINAGRFLNALKPKIKQIKSTAQKLNDPIIYLKQG